MPTTSEQMWCVACGVSTNMEGAVYLDRNPGNHHLRRISVPVGMDYEELPVGICRRHGVECVGTCSHCDEQVVVEYQYEFRHATNGRRIRHTNPDTGIRDFTYTCIRRCDRCRMDYFGVEGHPDRCRVILNYTYRPQPFIFHGGDYDNDDQSDPLFMGMELEVEIGRDLRVDTFGSTLLDALEEPEQGHSRVYLKSDGSIHHGFEIVTMPHTLEAFRESGIIETITGHTEQLALTEEASNVGIHIHVNRSAFRDAAHLWRFLQLHHRNPTFVKAVAGRGSTGYASWDEAAEMFSRSEEVARQKDRPWGHNSHGTVINTGNRDTIELRYFKATVVPERIYKNLEWVQSAWEYCQGATPPPLDALSFLDWIAVREENFPHFVPWLRENELLLDQADSGQLEAVLEPSFQ